MSLFRSSKLQNITSRFENLRERLVLGSRKSAEQMKPRRLLIDPLEERQLLHPHQLWLSHVAAREGSRD